MTKHQHINWWREEAEKNWETAVYLMNGRQNVFALFTFHLVIEKLLKAHWVKDNVPDYPPRIHDLTEIYNQTDLELDNGWYDYLATITDWNIEGRYPDYKRKIYLRATDEYLNEHFDKLQKLKECLLQKF